MPSSGNVPIRGTSTGVITLELLIALTVLILGITGSLLVSFGNQSLSADGAVSGEALSKAHAALENARATARESLSSLSNSTTTEGIYQKILSVQPIDEYGRRVTSRIRWNQSLLRAQTIELTTILADWKSALGGTTCSQTLTGNWQQPRLRGRGLIATGATDVDVLNKKAYLTSDPSAGRDEDFYIFDVADPDNPTLVNKLNTGPGLMSVHVAGNYAYVANKSINGQLQIIDISNPQAPVLVSTFKIPRVTGSGGGGVGNTILYANKKVYLGLTKTASGPEFNIIDVNDPRNPVYLGGWPAGTKINSILVKDTTTGFVATPMPTPAPPTRENLSILNISSPASITRLGTFTAPDPSTQDGMSMSLIGSLLYLGRSVGGREIPENHELFALDPTNPSAIVTRGSVNVAVSVHTLIIRSNLAFMTTSEPSSGFQIWDISNPTSVRRYAATAIGPTLAGGLDCEANLFFAAQQDSNALQIIGPGT